MKKINVGVIFGGKSTEHEVSLRSAENIIKSLDKEKYRPILIKIEKNGHWVVMQDFFPLPEAGGEFALKISKTPKIDVFFPVLHGIFGEDGTVQGLLKLIGTPFVGASVLGSAVGMDKEAMKKLLKEDNLPIGKFLISRDWEQKYDFSFLVKELGLPFFIKPANSGSSVGVFKITSQEQYEEKLKESFLFDRKVLLEEFIEGREIECSVLGNENPIASLPGEVIPQREFYSYQAKYLDEDGASFQIPVVLPQAIIESIKDMAVRVFKALYCEGMARVDFFLKKDGSIIVNEINTIPGFTEISMYPKLWQVSGLSYAQLIDKLIELAIDRFNKEKKLKSSFFGKGV